MALNHHFWERAFKRDFFPQLRAGVDVLSRRLIPAFDSISDESNAVAEDAWDSFMSGPATGDEDPGDFAEAAMDAGVSHFFLLTGIRQGMVNLFASALFHTFEQQVMFFLRRELLHPSEEYDHTLLTWKTFNERLGQWGIDYKKLDSWPTVREAELVANTVKHGDGRSASDLFALRPDLFQHPDATHPSPYPDKPRVDRPLLGEDVYVGIADIERYRDAMIGFWTDLVQAMGRVP